MFVPADLLALLLRKGHIHIVTQCRLDAHLREMLNFSSWSQKGRTATILVDHRLWNRVLELQPETDIDLSRCRKAIQDAGHRRDGCDVAHRPDVRPRYGKVGVIESIVQFTAKL